MAVSSAVLSTEAEPEDQAAFCEGLADLAQIYAEDVNVCVHAREANADLRAAARELAALGADQARTLVSPVNPDWRDLLSSRLGAQARDPLVAELNFLTWLTADLLLDDIQAAADAEIGVRLSVADGPQCPRFHVDRVHARVVTTWLGVGTEWLENGDCDRRWLGTPGTTDAESGLILHPARIGQAPEQAIVVLKGEAWPGFAGRGAVHRSPAYFESRVMVTMEPV